MVPLFLFIAGCVVFSCLVPRDEAGAEDFCAATAGWPVKQIADFMGVTLSQVTRFRQNGNVPGARIAMLPMSIQRRYYERQAKRAGAVVIERQVIDSGIEAINALLLSVGWRPVAAKATAGSDFEPDTACGKAVSDAA